MILSLSFLPAGSSLWLSKQKQFLTLLPQHTSSIALTATEPCLSSANYWVAAAATGEWFGKDNGDCPQWWCHS